MKKKADDISLDSFKDAYNEEFKFHQENILMLSWYVQRMLRTFRRNNLKSVISLGIGHEVVSETIIKNLGQSLEKHVIIEGSHEIARAFSSRARLPDSTRLVVSLFEEFETEERFDAVEMGFILEHVDDPVLILKKYSGLLKPNGLIFIAVPNARSLHRIVGFEAGLLADLYELSEHDLQLGHKRYFDAESLGGVVREAGLKTVALEGIFLKPLTTSQLSSLNLSPEVLRAFLKVGSQYPEISNAIYLEAAK